MPKRDAESSTATASCASKHADSQPRSRSPKTTRPRSKTDYILDAAQFQFGTKHDLRIGAQPFALIRVESNLTPVDDNTLIPPARESHSSAPQVAFRARFRSRMSF